MTKQNKMQSMTQKPRRKWVLLSVLSCVFALMLTVGIVFAAGNEPNTINVVYQSGTYFDAAANYTAKETNLFSNVTKTASTTISGTVILHGPTFENVIANDQLTLGNRPAKLDSETFYMQEGNANDLWAYSFTGWKISGASEKIPGETVFQPGDVITPEILEKYAPDGTLILEAVWGQCYFIKNPYKVMVYTQTDTTTPRKSGASASALYEVNHALSAAKTDNTTGSSDSNSGKNASNAVATIDHAFTLYRTHRGWNGANTAASYAELNKNPMLYDAYSAVIMLCGDVDYFVDANIQSKTYGYKGSFNQYQAAYISATFKSLGAGTGENAYKLREKMNINSTLNVNFRFDNIKHEFMHPTKTLTNETATSIFQGQPTNVTEYTFDYRSQDTYGAHYVEVTARSNVNVVTANSPIQTFRIKTDYAVVNGSSMGNVDNAYNNSQVKPFTKLRVGREAHLTAITMGGLSNDVKNFYTSKIDLKTVIVTGGWISNHVGMGSRGANAIEVSNKELYIYGDGSGNTAYDPRIPEIYGGSVSARTYGDVSVYVNGCTNITNVYGGGCDYTATVFGDIKLQIYNSAIQGAVYGGGKFANCEMTPATYIPYNSAGVAQAASPLANLSSKLTSRIGTVGGDVKLDIDNTSVAKNVYGSGMGATQVIEIFHEVRRGELKAGGDYPTLADGIWWDWEKPVSGYPRYDEDAKKILIGGYRTTIMWGGNYLFRTYLRYADLSVATVLNVTINIENGSDIHGNLYGGGSVAQVLNNTVVNIKNSRVRGNVFGGGDGVTQPDAVPVYPEADSSYQTALFNGTTAVVQKPTPSEFAKNSILYTWSNDASLMQNNYADTSKRVLYSPNTQGLGLVNGNTIVNIENATVDKNIYGGGDFGVVKGTTKVNLAGASTVVSGSVYGGGNLGSVLGNVDVAVSGGRVQSAVYAGANQANINGTATLTLTGGTVATAYGGNNQSGVISGDITVEMSGSATVTGSLFGGGNQADYAGNASVAVLGGNANTVYGGANMADMGNVTLAISGGNITTAFGGNNQSGAISGTVDVDVTGGLVGTLYGGGNQAAYAGTPDVDITGSADITTLYGGGKGAGATVGKTTGAPIKTLRPSPLDTTDTTVSVGTDVYINGENVKIGTLYGGGHEASVIGATYTVFANGTVTKAFGGNNISGTISGDQTFFIMEGGKVTDQLFGGGNQADYLNGVSTLLIRGGEVGDFNSPQNQDGTVTGTAYGGGNKAALMASRVVMTGGQVRSLFGGSREADIYGYDTFISSLNNVTNETTDIAAHVAVRVGVYGGEITTLLGGNDYSGDIQGDIIINIGDRTNPDTNPTIPADFSKPSGKQPYIRNLFGGGNQADYTYKADWNPNLHIRDELAPDNSFGGIRMFIHSGEVYQVFGGGVNAAISNSVVSVRGGLFHFIYGGGFKGDALNTALHIRGGNVFGEWLQYNQDALPTDAQGGYVFAGGYDGYVKNPNVHMVGGTVRHSLFGGGNLAGVGYSTVVIKGGTIRGSVYGGGYRGDAGYDEEGSALTDDAGTYVEITGGSIGQVMPGESGEYSYVGNIYGGGYRGTCLETHIDIAENRFTDVSTELILGGHIFGGGHEASVVGDTNIHYFTGEIKGNIYGGGRDGHVLGECYVEIFDGEIGGDINGGGLNGTTTGTHVLITDKIDTIREYLTDADNWLDKMGLTQKDIVVNIGGDVFGGGEGISATVLGETHVLIDLDYNFTVEEKQISTEEITSGETTPIVHEILQTRGDGTGSVPYSIIMGSVYGGGDLAAVGVGQINLGNNTASISSAQSTNVTVREGHIRGAVFGGGNGIPGAGQSYNLYMGTVFGTTNVLIKGGYIEGKISQTSEIVGGSVYGGGRQSRVYVGGAFERATTVRIDQTVNGTPIALGGSVFGGGDRGSMTATNATVPTVIGNVWVDIVGQDSDAGGAKIYFVKGGVYGDGNLCLVSGERTITITGLNTNGSTDDKGNQLLKTFYSLQRADQVILQNTDIVLLGAIDLVEEDDPTIYSVNRVGKLCLTQGSTVKLDQVVHALGCLESDILTAREFIIEGNNGENQYNSFSPDALTEAEINAYIAGNGELDMPTGEVQNTVCVANGLQLDIIDESGKYGTVKGLFSLGLLRSIPGEGGGFVYADIATSTGDFICVTKSGYQYSVVSASGKEDMKKEHETNGTDFYIRVPGVGYQLIEPDADGYYTEGLLYYTRETLTTYMTVVDNIGGVKNGKAGYYFWYINGSTIRYTGAITGYIGSEEYFFPSERTVPQHTYMLDYVLYSVKGNEVLADAISSAGKYQLVSSVPKKADGTYGELQGQQIAIEFLLADESLGFLTYDEGSDTWGIQNALHGNSISGYQGAIDQMDNNKLAVRQEIGQGMDNVTIVLHKSLDVNAELSGMKVNLDIDLVHTPGVTDEGGDYPDNAPYTKGAGMMLFDIDFNIVRLVPVQSVFASAGKVYGGVPLLQDIYITGESAFTAEFFTKYIPGAFPEGGENTMHWYLTTAGYTYYYDALGRYITVDSQGNIINRHADLKLMKDLTPPASGTPEQESVFRVTDDAGLDHYYYYTGIENSGYENNLVELTPAEGYTSVDHIMPKGTKITLVDYSSGQPAYYYYTCTKDTTMIDLFDFCIMGTSITIEDTFSNAAYASMQPAFVSMYRNTENLNTRVTERLLFVFDYYNVDWTQDGYMSENVFAGHARLQHFYGDITTDTQGNDQFGEGHDIMDYVKSVTNSAGLIDSYIRYAPGTVNYSVNDQESGINEDQWKVSIESKPIYYSKDTVTLQVSFGEDSQWINTLLGEGEYSVKIELFDANGVRIPMPAGIYFTYNGVNYHPGSGGYYAVVPIVSSLQRIDVTSPLYGFPTGEKITFKVTLYSSADARYYNVLDTTCTGEASCTFRADREAAVDGSVDQSIYAPEDTVTLTVNSTYTDALSSDMLVASIEYKGVEATANGFDQIDWSDVFVTDAQSSTATFALGSQTASLTLKDQLAAGTYRIVLTVGRGVGVRTHYIYFIVK